MAVLLNGWAGDHAGGVVGRKPNTLIVAMTLTDHSREPYGLYETARLGRTTAFYPAWRLACLTPNAREALATDIREIRLTTWEIEVAEMDSDHDKDPWVPGVHLFGVELIDDHYGMSTTIATAVINDDVTRLHPKQVEVSEIWDFFDKSMLQRHSTSRPRPDWP